MANFPLIMSTVAERRQSRVADAIRDLEAAKENGAIANPKFIEAKSLVNDTLNKAWETLISERFTYGGRWQELPEDIYNVIGYTHPAAHTMAGLVKKITSAKAKLGDHAVFGAAETYFAEAVPLSNLLLAAKDLVVKKQAKAPEETAKQKYSKPALAGTAVDQVKLLLMQIVEQGATELRATLVKQYNRYIDVYLERQAKANEEGKALSPYDAFRASRHSINMDAYEVVSRCTKEDREATPLTSGRRRTVYIKADDIDTYITDRAEKVAAEIEEAFVYKNLSKIDTIVSAKGDYASGKMLSSRIGSGLEGRINFTFKDGASFTVQNSVVYSHSVHGTPFLRFPLTFHDVVMTDGSKMKGPSEERMNTVWLGKEA